MKEFEILSPVGDEKSFYAAINNGANAIYMGLKNFNARDKAENFSTENLQKFVKFAHLHSVKVYITVNTILTNEEIPSLVEMIRECVKSKVDAFIVQDFGVAAVLKNTFPNIVLHASTQMGIHSLEGAKIAKELGFSRIVLSRETSLEDIKNIKENCDVEIEYFVHGALCVCFSGNCYLSSLSFNESGNRGRCLQPCRLPITALNDKKEVNKGYLLSTTDLCLIKNLKTLYDIGVCSLKIEGRLRRPSYVAYATKSYSQAKEFLLKNAKFSLEETLENFKKLFYRGEYNSGLYLEKPNNLKTINPKFQNHRGVLIGTVLETKPFKDITEILIVTNGYEIKQNDGLKFVFKNQEQSLGVGGVRKANKKDHYFVYTKVKPVPQAEVYLTVDNEWEKSLEDNKKIIDFSANFEAIPGKKPILKLSCKGVEISQILFENCEKAKNQALTFEEVKKCLEKTNDTSFKLKNLKCNLQNVFMTKANLNELRRKAIETLEEKLIESFEQKNCKEYFENSEFLQNFNEKDLKTQNNSFVVFNENTNFEEVLKQSFLGKKVVFAPINFEENLIKKYAKKLKENNVLKFYIDLPKVARKEDFEIIKNIIFSFKTTEIGVVANNISGLIFIKFGYEVVGGVYLNIANNFTVKALNNFGVCEVVKSFENFAKDFGKGLTYCGKPALMTVCHCPYKTSFGNSDCCECKFTNSLQYKTQNGKIIDVRRTKIKNCLFELVSNESLNFEQFLQDKTFSDLR